MSFRDYLVAGFLCVVPTLVLGQIQPQRPADVAALEYHQPELSWRHDQRLVFEVPQRAADLAQNLRDLSVPESGARVDVRGGRWSALLPSHPLIPGSGVGNTITWPTNLERNQQNIQTLAWENFMQYLQIHESQLGISPLEIEQPGKVTVHRDGALIQIYANRMIDGINVEKSHLSAVVNHGNLTLVSAVNWGDMDARLDRATRMTGEDAQLLTQQYVGRTIDRHWRAPELRIVTMSAGDIYDFARGYTYRLVYAVSPNLGGNEDGHWECLVDAYSGEILAFQDTFHYFNNREVKGGVYPITNTGVAAEGGEQVAGYPMPYGTLSHVSGDHTTDTGGNVLQDLIGQITATLEGPFLEMFDECGNDTLTESSMDDALDFGVSGVDCDTPPGSTSASNTSATRTGFYEIGKIQEMARGHLPMNSWLQDPLPATMNINETCNATGGPSELRFYRSGGGCSNTGELAGVFDHEWGHGMDGADATPGISSPGEGIADIYASLRLNTSCMGRNFSLGTNCGGYGDPCLDCDGVRDIDYANRMSGQPHDIAWVDTNCPGGFFSFGPCGESVHCGGAVYAEAVWDLWNRDLQAAPYSMGVHQAREIAAQLTFVGAGGVTSWFTCNTAGEGGCNGDGGYLNFLSIDDDDGDVMNGTPHMGAIFAAFDRHGAACSMPAVQDSGCAGTPTTAPTVNAMSQDYGASLSWSAVAGATSYRVYRTEGEFGCDFGKVLLTDTASLGFVDMGLQNGREYYYQVAAMGPMAPCIGPLSACRTVTPGAGLNCANSSYENWPLATVEFFIGCINASPKTKQVARARPTLSTGVGSLAPR